VKKHIQPECKYMINNYELGRLLVATGAVEATNRS